MGWQDGTRPPPSHLGEAMTKIFEMADAMCGCLSADEADNWRAWINEVRVRYMTRDPRCSLCGATGHRMQTCALNTNRIEVDE